MFINTIPVQGWSLFLQIHSFGHLAYSDHSKYSDTLSVQSVSPK